MEIMLYHSIHENKLLSAIILQEVHILRTHCIYRNTTQFTESDRSESFVWIGDISKRIGGTHKNEKS